jgi:hypothetical protein
MHTHAAHTQDTTLLAGAIAHLNTLLHTGCPRASAQAVMCLTRYAQLAHTQDSIAAMACLELADTLAERAH